MHEKSVRICNCVSSCLVRWPGLLEKEGARIECMDSRQHYFTTYESNVLYALRFMVDCGVVGVAGGLAPRFCRPCDLLGLGRPNRWVCNRRLCWDRACRDSDDVTLFHAEQVGGNWIELPAGEYDFTGSGRKCETHCQLEAHVHFSKLVRAVHGVLELSLKPCPPFY